MKKRADGQTDGVAERGAQCPHHFSKMYHLT